MIDVRLARPEEAEAIAAVVHAAYRTGGERAWTTESHLVAGQRTTPARVRELMESPGHAILVAEREGRILGTVHLEADGSDGAFLGMLSVDPREQAGGVGRAILEAAETHAKEHMRARRIEMDVITLREELLAWYERRGYRRTGATRPFVAGTEERFLRGPLSFARLEKVLR